MKRFPAGTRCVVCEVAIIPIGVMMSTLSIAALLAKESPKTPTATAVGVVIVAIAAIGFFIVATRRFR